MRLGDAEVPKLVSVIYRDAAYLAQGEVLTAAQDQLADRCMARHGFAAPREEYPPQFPTAPPDSRTGYGLFAAMSALTPAELRAARDPSASAAVRYLRQLSPARQAAYRGALYGSRADRASVTMPGWGKLEYGTGGCDAGATARLYGSPHIRGVTIARQNVAGLIAGRRLARDVRLRRALAEWRTCMRARGLRDASPEAARGRMYDRYLRARAPASVRRSELLVARADRACDRVTQVYAELERAWHEAARSLPVPQIRWMRRVVEERTAALRRARAVLADLRSR